MYAESPRFEPLTAERIDSFVRLSAPCILRLTGRSVSADLLAALMPFEHTDRGRQWRSILPPLRRQLLPLRAEAACARRRAGQRPRRWAVDIPASDVHLVARFYPAIHRNTVAVRAALAAAPELGRAIGESVRLSAVVATLSASEPQPDGRHGGLVRIDEHLRAAVRFEGRRPSPVSKLDVLVNSYLDARRSGH